MTPDLLGLIEDALRAKPERDDKALAHMSAVVCDRQSWAERKGLPFEPFDFRTLIKFELGHQFEAAIADTLQAELERDYFISRDYAIAWDPIRDVTHAIDEQNPAKTHEIVGHVDFYARSRHGTEHDFLLEIKSTSFLRGRIPEEAQPHYVEQAALYAAALIVPHFGILVGCRESGKLAEPFWFDTSEKLEWARARAQEIIESTDPRTYMPPAEPRTSWGCRTCRFSGCERNPSYVAPSMEVAS
jgi:hypothetical protein